MSGVVVVDDYADEVAEEEPISAEDEQNLKEIEDYIFNNVLGDDDENFEMMRKAKEEEAMEEIELAMLSAESKAFSPGSYTKPYAKPVSMTNAGSGYDSQQNMYNYSYGNTNGDMVEQAPYGYADTGDWYNEYKDCNCCGGYIHHCSCVSEGYPSCANCSSNYNGAGAYTDGYSTQNVFNSFNSDSVNNNCNSSKHLSTTAVEFVPSTSTRAQAPNYGYGYSKPFQPKSSYGGSGNSSGVSSTPCNMFSKEGYCKRGNKCKFAHVA